MSAAFSNFRINLDDPRAPTEEDWAAMSADEQQWVIEHLPSEFWIDNQPPEGEFHYTAVKSSREQLRGYFERIQKRVYIANGLAVYYPGEKCFSPDVMAVLDVDDHPRNSWIKSKEGKGIDFALEVHWLGDRAKDFVRNVGWYARLGIQEYFAFDMARLRFKAYRLQGGAYAEISRLDGRFHSQVLELDVGIEGDRIQFFAGSAPLPDSEDLIRRLNAGVLEASARAEEQTQRAQEEARRAEEEARRAEEEARRAEEEAQRADAATARAAELELQLSEALAELARLKAGQRS
jgi:hypothetical protein